MTQRGTGNSFGAIGGLLGFIRDPIRPVREMWRRRRMPEHDAAGGRVTFVSPVAAGMMSGLFILLVAGLGLGLLYSMTYRAHFRLLRDNLGILVKIAASQVDGDLHSGITRPDQVASAEYDRAVEPLIGIHNSDPDIHYLYTERYLGSVSYYILDTATRAGRLKVRWNLKPSAIMEPVDQNDPEEDAACLEANRNGRVYVYKTTYRDPEYGTFLTASAPFSDSKGRFEGVVSIDYSTGTLESAMSGLKRVFFVVMGMMLMISAGGGIFIGFITHVIENNARERRRSTEERIDLERRIHHTQRLESLGLMAGGIAHDFNNILTVIIGNIDLIRTRILRQMDVTIPLEEARKASFRASDLTRQMLAYTGKDRIEPEPLMLNTLVHESVAFLRGSISKMIAVDMKTDPKVPIIRGDPSQLQQVIMNLVLNSAEAIGEKEGAITLATGVLPPQEIAHDREMAADLTGRGVVYIDVIDTGCGMDDDTRERMFDPFFTTKFTGRGLGMSAVLGIVKSHHGGITVRSAPGAGTSVRVLLPVMENTVSPLSLKVCDDYELLKGRFSGTVLVVDDEESVLRTATSMLCYLGFSVLEARDGIEAVSTYSIHSEAISLVILDVTMPRMDGIRTFDALSGCRAPGVRIYISSGYPEENIYERFRHGRPDGFIHKPYDLGTLCGVMRSVFDA